MTDREVMKLALEALEDIHPGNMTPMAEEYWGKAIAALRQALDQLPDTTKMTEPDMGIDRGAWDDVPDATKWVDELRGGDETEEQEPVACKHNRYSVDVHEQTGTCYDCGAEGRMRFAVDDTAPPKREWVGLTDEERYLNDCRSEEDIEYARAIEAKLKEKNS